MERFSETYDDVRLGRLSCADAALFLGCSERHFLRLRERFDDDGLAGLADRRVGRVSRHRAADEEIETFTRLYREQYMGFNVRHFHEFAQREHGLRWGYTWTRLILFKAGLAIPSKRGGPHRLRRPRRAMRGMMIHQDASTHRWFGADNCDLVVTLDDANSEITSAFFCDQEGTNSSLRGIHETIAQYGLFCSFYTDRGSHYFFTPEVGSKVDKTRPTEVGRALRQLGITHIAAYSPEARGRSERMFGTLQGRLVKELEHVSANTMTAANRYLRETYLPRHNKQFMVKPELEDSAYLPVAGWDIANVLCIQEDRIVAADNTVHYKTMKLQIPPGPMRHHYVKSHVRVHHYPDDTMAIFHGPREIGRYQANGILQQEKQKHAA